MKFAVLIDNILYHFSQPRLNIVKTIFFNLKTLPFKQALKLPVLIYGPVKFYWLKGNTIINSDTIFRGMIKLGRNNEFFNGVDNSSFISLGLGSLLIFDGPCAISNNYKIRLADGANMKLGAYTFFGSSIKLICLNRIIVGNYTRCAYESQLVDSNFHFVYDETKKCVARRTGEIILGSYNWIGNRTVINKNTRTKDYTIVCSGSLLNKDYTKNSDEKQMLAGYPAKIIASNKYRIFSTGIERKLIEYFNSYPHEEYCNFVLDKNDNMNDLEYWFEHVM